jgi:Domain of unknown function (DUF4253)
MLPDILRQVGIDPDELIAPDYQLTPDRPVFLLHIPRLTPYLQWTALRERLPAIGYWSVLAWDFFGRPPASYNLLAPDAPIEMGSAVDIDAWLAEQEVVPSLMNGCQASERALHTPPIDFMLVRPDRTSPETRWNNWGARQGKDHVPLSLIPVDMPGKVPAYLPITVEVPTEVQIGMQKRWFERWGAELVSATPPNMDLPIQRPPAMMADACVVAAEMIGYCWWLAEIATADTEEEQVAELASQVLKSTVWSFHW